MFLVLEVKLYVGKFWFEFINFYFIPGLVLGCIYALGAIGITLTFGILRFANFAHGEIMMTIHI